MTASADAVASRDEAGKGGREQQAVSLRDRLSPHHIWLFATWLGSRLALVGSLTLNAEFLGAGDLARYGAVADALLSGQDVRVWEYPFGALAFVVPPALVGTEYTTYMIAFVSLAVAVDFVALVGVLWASPTGVNLRGAWLWVWAVPSLGVLALTRLDMAACALMALSAAHLWRNGVSRRLGVLIAMAAAVKVWPGVLAAAVTLARPRGWLRLWAGLMAMLAALIIIACSLGLGGLLPDFLEYQRARGLQLEALLALPLLWADYLGVARYKGEFHFGSQQLEGQGVHVAALLSTLLMLVGIAVISARLMRLRARRTATGADLLVFATLGVWVLITTNKVFSPQYLLWVIVMYAVVGSVRDLLDSRTTVALIGACLLTHVIFPFQYSELVDRELVPLIFLTLRDMLILYLTARLARFAWRLTGDRNSPAMP